MNRADGVVRGLAWLTLLLISAVVAISWELGHQAGQVEALERQVAQLELLHREDVEPGPDTWGQGRLADERGEAPLELQLGPVVPEGR